MQNNNYQILKTSKYNKIAYFIKNYYKSKTYNIRLIIIKL